MLTATERRRLVLGIRERDLTNPAAIRLVRTARAIIKRNADKLATFLCCRGENSDELPRAESIVAVIKPVGDHCNLRCRYCFNKPSSFSQRMSEDVLESIIAQVLTQNPGATDFIFHGGEPLLAGITFFEKALSFEERYRRSSQRVRNSVMTNATLLNSRWAEFFSHHKFRVGVSLDGPPNVHDRNRVDASGRGTFERVIGGIESLQACGVEVNSISVIPAEPAVSARELFAFITSLGISAWRVNPCRSEGKNHYAKYVEDLFDVWASAEEESNIAIIQETLEGQLGYPPKTCWMKGTCRRVIGFEPDGVVSPCCEMSVKPPFQFGNMRQAPLAEILQAFPAREFWEERKDAVHRDCTSCTWTHLCGGGCTYHRLQFTGAPGGKDYLCETYQDVFRRLTASIDSVLMNASKPARLVAGESASRL